MLAVSMFFIIFHRDAFSKITKASFVYAQGFALFILLGFLLMTYAWELAPQKLSVIMVTIGFCTIITAVIGNFIGSKLDFYQWIGAFIALLGVILVSLGKQGVNNIINIVKS